jgi:hypothetical protein
VIEICLSIELSLVFFLPLRAWRALRESLLLKPKKKADPKVGLDVATENFGRGDVGGAGTNLGD